MTSNRKALRVDRARDDQATRQRVSAIKELAPSEQRRKLDVYGLTPEQHKTMLEAQGGLCAICRGIGDGRSLLVDHCHETGMVRGLLCRNAILALGCSVIPPLAWHVRRGIYARRASASSYP